MDSVLTALPETRLDSMSPDIVISVGGSLVSRKLKEYLRRNNSVCEHWSVGWNHTTSDCFMSLTKRIEADPARFLHQLYAAAVKHVGDSSYSSIWNEARREAFKAKDEYVDSIGWSELKAFSIIDEMLPRDVNLFLSNGTSVRYAQIVGKHQPHATYCNRGVSGIDGCGSTAVGGAMKYNGKTVLVTGDMSMAYDVAALSLPGIPDRMRIIVIDNNGGGIFRFIPSTSRLEERERYFCCAPQLPLRHLAEGYGWEYHEATDETTLRESLSMLLSSPKRGVLRIVCDGESSAAILRQYMQITVPE